MDICKNCGKRLSKEATMCPKFGKPHKKQSTMGLVYILGLFFLFLIIFKMYINTRPFASEPSMSPISVKIGERGLEGSTRLP